MLYQIVGLLSGDMDWMSSMDTQTSPEPWDRRPLPSAGDASVTETYAAVGEALTEWGKFECDLALLFCAFVSAAGAYRAADRAYTAVRTFEGRLEMLRAAAEVHFSTAKYQTIKRHFNRVTGTDWRKYAERRNEIAHGIVQPYSSALSHHVITKHQIAGRGYCLFPPYNEFRKTTLDREPVYAYSSIEIRHYAAQFRLLSDSALDITRVVSFDAPICS
jgi:hypothetical protein